MLIGTLVIELYLQGLVMIHCIKTDVPILLMMFIMAVIGYYFNLIVTNFLRILDVP